MSEQMEHIHLIGIGGTGLSAIARVLAQQGYRVSGSDQALSPLAQSLQDAGIQVIVGQRAENVRGADLVVRSSAIPDSNPEVQAALSAGIPVLKRIDFLARLIGERRCLAVAGTHGKTTTTSMLAWTLSALQRDPSYIIGGVALNLGANAAAGKGLDFVIEADEYDHMFLGLNPAIAVVTNVEYDHPDCYPTPQDYQRAFADFAGRIQAGGALITCADDPGAVALAAASVRADLTNLSYSLAANADYHAAQLTRNAQGCPEFSVQKSAVDQPLAHLSLQVPGEHNVRNALAAMAVVDRLGLDLTQAAQALSTYQGSGRRFELKGEAGGISVIDDYAHHPAEIRSTLAAARERFAGRRIWAVWQPHTYSRTRTLADDFAQAFSDADQVVVTEIYAAREPQEDYSSAQIVSAMPAGKAIYAANLQIARELLLAGLETGDVLIVLSAGDADQLSAAVLKALKEKVGQNA